MIRGQLALQLPHIAFPRGACCQAVIQQQNLGLLHGGLRFGGSVSRDSRLD
ncbi:hypothetical protein D3C87_2115520 [compost metagenome]